MIEVAQLAQEAIDALSPMLHEAGPLASKAMGGFASHLGGELFRWLSEQVKGKPAAATLDRAVAEPDNSRRIDSLRLEIEEMAERDEAFRQQLTELLKAAGPSQPAATQSANPIGDGNKIGQIIGSNSSIRIR